MLIVDRLAKQFRQIWQPRKGLAIAEASIIGIVAAVSAVLLKQSSGWLGTWRIHSTHILPAWLVLPLIGMSFGFFAGWLIQRFAPEAAGSGIPQVKASLGNVPIRLSWQVVGIKLISTIFALGSGLILGRQGPTIQVGAGLAAGMSRLVPTSPEHRRQMIAAGAGAGLSAAFNAPITGVLFIIEELLKDLSELTLGTAIIACFIGGVISRLLGGGTLQLNRELVNYSAQFYVPEIPIFLLLGVIIGLFSAVFRHGLRLSLKIYQRLHITLPLRVALAGLISGLIVALLPEYYRDNAGLREYMIASEPNLLLATITFISQFILTLIAFGSGAPGGLFAPSLILGSCLGHIIGVFEVQFLGFGSLNTYALAGMGGFFSAVSKVPITAIVIVFELTTDFNLVLPLMIVAVTAYLVADYFVPGSLYDELLKLNGITIEKNSPIEGVLTKLKAEDVMQKRVETLDAQMSIKEAIQAFSRSHHRGFPVVDQGQLVGIITQSDIKNIYPFQYTTLREIMTPGPVTVQPDQGLSEVLYLLDRHQISRLPVVEKQKILGIITRGDIIRAEADSINCKNIASGPQPEPSYLVYQTRSPSTGRGRLLVTLSNPDTAETLLEMAATIAQERHYELECLQIILVSRHSSPSETKVRTTKSKRILRQAESLAKRWQVPIHTQIRVAHDVAQAILETIKERHIDLIFMGWKGNTSTPGRIFGTVVDTIIRQATCDVVLVKLSSLHNKSYLANFHRWLVPMAGGPNAPLAIKLLPALVSLVENPQIRLTQVVKPWEKEPDMHVLEESTRQLIRNRNIHGEVIAASLQGESVSQAVIELVNTEGFDVVVLGASREGLLQQAIHGNIPETIASGVNSTVILVRGEI
ncbi:chloride channel protein [Cylindrospermopsis raciborskii CENA303]|uniref:Chloride channel protein n=1 Tax=Cylindrospermopsis raciborskii CENA303 TaxID=1170769 RepID=A0A1X4GBG1_9CYAN|nr:chloride channel protein [Cylindrospermopsis raciborskii]OSO94518.1 chloride channel protein [Cylindrospermopsis raciborskii CENA303]